MRRLSKTGKELEALRAEQFAREEAERLAEMDNKSAHLKALREQRDPPVREDLETLRERANANRKEALERGKTKVRIQDRDDNKRPGFFSTGKGGGVGKTRG